MALLATLLTAAAFIAWSERNGRARALARARAEEITFTKDIAPLVLARCAPCHRPGEVGPFSLLTYDDVSKRAAQIQEVTASRFMPPWKARHGTGPYANDRSLSDAQIALLDRWVREGAKRGDPADMPAEPVWPKGWRLGEPDVVFELPEPYVLGAEGSDVYRNFVIPANVVGTRYVTAWELQPGSPTVHHAIMNVDRFGVARALDAASPGPGYGDGMQTSDSQSPDGFYLLWVPGKAPTPAQPGMAWRIDPQTDLVLALHLQPTGKPETIRPKVALYLSDKPPTIQRYTLFVQDPPIDIPAGAADYAIHSEYVIPGDVTVLSVIPHAHLLGKTVTCRAILPDKSERLLVQIDDWDFGWQNEYTFATPLSLPEGAKVTLDITYDNSDKNVRNPNRPPKRVRGGPGTRDEMGDVVFQVIPRNAQSLLRLRKARYRKDLENEDVPRNHYNLANVLADEGKVEQAIAHYKRATEQDAALWSPYALASAYFNMANLLLQKGDRPAAIAAYESAIKVSPGFIDALINLGHAIEPDKPAEAIARFRQALAVDPKSALANYSLAAALAKKGDRAGAIQHFRAGLEVEPKNAGVHMLLAKVLEENGDADAARLEREQARKLDPRLPNAAR